MRRSLKVVIAGLASFGCAAALERNGPDHGVYCALGKVEGYDIYCPELKLNGGWPAPFLFDRPGVSVEHKLNVIEDEFRPWPFVSDVAFYLVLLVSLNALPRLVRSWITRGRTGSPHRDK